jgi:hypothetical protein
VRCKQRKNTVLADRIEAKPGKPLIIKEREDAAQGGGAIMKSNGLSSENQK